MLNSLLLCEKSVTFANNYIQLDVNISVKEKESLFIARVLYSSFDLNNIVDSTKFAVLHK